MIIEIAHSIEFNNRWNGRKLHLEFYLSFEGNVIEDNLDGVGAAEGGGQLNIAFYKDK